MPPPVITLPFDNTASLESNYIKREIHTLTSVNSAPYRILLPEYPPFYTTGLVVEHLNEHDTARQLVDGVDYYVSLPYMAASRASGGRQVYGGVTIINELINGLIRISYRALGGDWVADRDFVYARILEHVYNPRTCWWDQITNVQQQFPSNEHDLALSDVRNVEVLHGHLDGIRRAILDRPQTLPATMIAHISSANPHGLTGDDLGLKTGAYRNVALDSEVRGGLDTDNLVTVHQLYLFMRFCRIMDEQNNIIISGSTTPGTGTGGGTTNPGTGTNPLNLTTQEIAALKVALDLKGASSRDVGYLANQCAAGDHSHSSLYMSSTAIQQHKLEESAHIQYSPTGSMPYISGDGSSEIQANAFKHYGVWGTNTLKLPASPLVGDWVIISSSIALTVKRNGKRIMHLDEDMTMPTLSTPGAPITITLRYVSPSAGWVIVKQSI